MAELLFYLLSAAAIAFGVGVVSVRSPLASVLSLLGSFVCLAVIYLLSGFQFLAAAQVLVYAGAVMVLFLFVIMLLNLGDSTSSPVRPLTMLGPRRTAVAAASAGALALVGVLGAGLRQVIGADNGAAAAAVVAESGAIDSLDAIAAILFSRYVLPFEAASLLLLATMVAVILLAKRQRGPAGEDAVVRDEGAGYPYHEGAQQ